MNSSFLNNEDFLEVIERAPLVSIDLVVLNSRKQMLLGQRRNEPAKGSWFVPGGRIQKNEDLHQAFGRITESELGVAQRLSGSRLLGAFSHHYSENFLLRDGISTHYIVLAYEILNWQPSARLPADQHGQYRWWSAEEALCSESVHANTLAYFGLNEEI